MELKDEDGKGPRLPSYFDIIQFIFFCSSIYFQDSLMSMIDSICVGRKSSVELAALNPACLITDQGPWLFFFLSIATSNEYGRALASRSEEKCARVVACALYLAFSIGLMMTFLVNKGGLWLLGRLAGGASADVIPAAMGYVAIRAQSYAASLSLYVLKSASMARQNVRDPLIATGVSMFFNLALDFLLIFKANMGIRGAAAATAVSQWVACTILFFRLMRTSFRGLKAERRRKKEAPPSVTEFMQKTFKLPNGAELWSFFRFAGAGLSASISDISLHSTLTHVASYFGSTSLAAHQICYNLYGVFMPPCDALYQAVMSLVPVFLFYQPEQSGEQAEKGGRSSPSGVSNSTETSEDSEDESEEADAVSMPTLKGVYRALPLFKRLAGVTGAISVFMATAAVMMVTFGAGLYTSDPTVLEITRKILPFMAIVSAQVPILYCMEGVLSSLYRLSFVAFIYLSACAVVASWNIGVLKPVLSGATAADTAALGGLQGAVTSALSGLSSRVSSLLTGAEISLVWQVLATYQLLRYVPFLIRAAWILFRTKRKIEAASDIFVPDDIQMGEGEVHLNKKSVAGPEVEMQTEAQKEPAARPSR